MNRTTAVSYTHLEVNEDAMVLEMISKDFKGLFTGDIGMVTEEKLIQNGCLEDVDFLKTAHHGSRYSTGAEFLEIVRPELAVVSCSATNTYGHPSPDTLERLKKMCIRDRIEVIFPEICLAY